MHTLIKTNYEKDGHDWSTDNIPKLELIEILAQGSADTYLAIFNYDSKNLICFHHDSPTWTSVDSVIKWRYPKPGIQVTLITSDNHV